MMMILMIQVFIHYMTVIDGSERNIKCDFDLTCNWLGIREPIVQDVMVILLLLH